MFIVLHESFVQCVVCSVGQYLQPNNSVAFGKAPGRGALVICSPSKPPLFIEFCEVQGKKRVGKKDCVVGIERISSHGPSFLPSTTINPSVLGATLLCWVVCMLSMSCARFLWKGMLHRCCRFICGSPCKYMTQKFVHSICSASVKGNHWRGQGDQGGQAESLSIIQRHKATTQGEIQCGILALHPCCM